MSHSQKKAVRVVISGAAGQIGYSLIPLVASGDVFGPTQPVILHLLDIQPMEKTLSGVVMEIDDANYPLVQGVVATSDPNVAFKDVNYAILVGGFPRKQGMERKDLMEKNAPIFITQGQALDKHAARDVKVLVVANPANTNCAICALNAPSLPKTAFSALTRLDHNRARAQIANKLKLNVDQVKNVIIWGNHSSTQVPDLNHASVTVDGKEQPAKNLVDEKWVSTEFRPTVQKRGAAVIAARGNSSAMSAAKAAADHMATWVKGTVQGEFVSMGVWSDGSYGVTKDIVFSYPVTCENGSYKIVQNLAVADDLKPLLQATEKELIEEKGEALGLAAAKDQATPTPAPAAAASSPK